MEFNREIRLESRNIILKPISLDDYQGLYKIALEEELWLHTPTRVTENNLTNYIENGLNDWKMNKRMMFTIFDKNGGIVGSTSIGNFSFENLRAEIGWTWLGQEFQGKGINQICKHLLLKFCFEELKFNRVEFKTDTTNLKSRRALKKIGAIEEGVLRKHTLLNNGKWRDTIYYSILSTEWGNLKNNLIPNS